MTLGSTLFVQSIRSMNGIAVDKMLGGLFAGMVWGMVASVGLYRLFFVIRDRLDQTASMLPSNKKAKDFLCSAIVGSFRNADYFSC